MSAAFNAAAGFAIVFVQADGVIDTTAATILGWSGWIVPGILVAVLLAIGGFRRPAERSPRGAPATEPVAAPPSTT